MITIVEMTAITSKFLSTDPDPLRDVVIALLLICIFFLLPVCIYLYMILITPRTEAILHHQALALIKTSGKSLASRESSSGNLNLPKCSRAHLTFRDITLIVEESRDKALLRNSSQKNIGRGINRKKAALALQHGNDPERDNRLLGAGNETRNSISTSSKTVKRKVLSGISGFVKAGTLCAIMGPSGAWIFDWDDFQSISYLQKKQAVERQHCWIYLRLGTQVKRCLGASG